MAKIEKIRKNISEIIPRLFESGFIVYCGAGISIPPPSCAPSWWTLAEEVLVTLFENVPDDWDVPKDIDVKDSDFQPEALFENWATIHGNNLYEAFKVLNVNAPNGNHQILAKLAKAGLIKAIFTTNFDIYIERALKEEGVEFKTLVDNSEYIEFFEKINAEGFKDTLLVCKIHGTITRPDTIIAVASAYKGAGGFSKPKADLFSWLIERIPCLFLGYSGWDFDHSNYRKFWEKAGSSLRGIYWNLRPGENPGPNFDDIFSTCREKFTFVESDLPDGLIDALKQNNQAGLDLNNIIDSRSLSAIICEQARLSRRNFLINWTKNLPDPTKLTTIMIEAPKHSKEFKQNWRKSTAINQNQDMVNNIQKLIKDLQDQFDDKQISKEIYEARLKALKVQEAMMRLPMEFIPTVNKHIMENSFPGITDQEDKKILFLSYIATLSLRLDIEDSIALAADIIKRDEEIRNIDFSQDPLLAQKISLAEVMVNQFRLNTRPTEAWNSAWLKLNSAKEKFLKGEIEQADFLKLPGELAQNLILLTGGRKISIDDLLKMLLELVANSLTKEEFVIGCRALFWAIDYVKGNIRTDVMQSKENEALLNAANLSETPENSNQFENGHPIIPDKLLNDYVDIYRQILAPVLEKQKILFSKEINESSILLDMCILSIVVFKFHYIEKSYSQEFQQRKENGQYELIRGNPSAYRYLRKVVEPWLDKAFSLLTERTGQRLCYFLVKLGELGNDLSLCVQATETSLAYTSGKMTELTPQEGPSSLATFYEDLGDKESALKYYKIALDGIQLAYPPYWQFELIYRTALLLKDQGDLKEALRIIGTYHSEFRGQEPSYQTYSKAKTMCIELATQISMDLGFEDVFSALDSVF